MANQTLKPFSGELDPVDSASGLKPFTGTLDGEKPQRTLAQAAKDTGAQLAEGVNTTLGAIPSVVAPQSRAAGFFRDNAQYWRDQQSDVLKDRIAASDQRIQEAGKDGVLSQIGAAASEYWNDPAQAARLVATNLPSMAATLGTGAVAGLAAKGVAAARGLDAANKAALAAKYGTTTAAATNAALNAGGARGEAFEDLQRAAIAQGMTPEQAEQAGVSGSILPGVVGGVAGAISGKIGLEKAILGQATTGAAMRKAAGAFGAELAGEQIEELAPKVATNYQVGQIDPGRTLTDDLGRTMVETAIGSGPGAVVAGGASAMRTGETPPPPGAGEPTTSPGAADPNAPQRPLAAPPEAPDLTTSPGAGVARDGMDFTREVDTSGLSLQDPAELARQRAATVDYQPGDTTPQWDTQPGAAAPRTGLDMPAPEFDTGSLGIDNRTPSERMGLDPAKGSLTRIAALAVDTGASPVQFLGATGRDLQVRATGPGVTDNSNVIDVQGRLVEDRAISTPRRLTDQQDGMAARAQGDRLAIQPPTASSAVPTLGGSVGADAARGAATAVPDGVTDGRTGGGSAEGNGTGAAEAGVARTGGRGNSNPALSAPTNLRDGLARMRARRQEAADAQAAAQSVPTQAQAVPAARTGAMEAAGVAPGVDPATRRPASSWVIRDKATGSVVTETTQKSVADKINTKKYEAVPIGQHLASLNQAVASNARSTGNAADASGAIFAAVDSSTTGANSEPTSPQAQQTAPQQPQAPASPGLTNAATTQNDGAQGQAAPGAQGAAQAAQAGVAPRPKNWRTSMLGAVPVAKAMGIDTKGKRLAQVVAEIDARDTQAPATSAPAPTPGPARLGRDNTPLSEGGKPFKTRKAAGDAKKLQPMMRVVTVPGGYALAEKTPAQLAAEERAAKRLRTPRTSPAGEPVPAHAFIAASGGLHMRHRNDLGVDGNPRIGNRTLFAGQGRGLSMDQATQMLIQDGYLSEGATINDALSLIKTSLTRPQYNADGIERIAQAESDAQFEDYLAAQEEAAADGDTDPFGMADEFTAEELDEVGYTSADPALQAEVSALIAQAEAMDIDTFAILEDIARTYANATQDQYNAAARDALAQAIARGNQDGGSVAAQTAPAAEPAADQGLDQPAALELASQTPAEWLADSASERFSVGRSLTKAQRRQVLASLVDAYKAKGAQREFKGLDGNGNERYGYIYSPDLFEKSDITGAMIRYYVTLPDGRIAHPSELFPDVSASDVERMALEQDRKRIRLDAFDNAIKPYYSDFDSANLMAVQGQVVIEKNGRFAIIPERTGAIGQARQNGWELASPSGQVSEQSAGTRAVREQQDGLTSYTAEEATQRQEAAEQAAKAEAAAKRAEDAAAKAEDERKRIAQASVRAADRFELGQDPMDSLTGQGSIFDDATAQSAPTAASDDGGRERFTLSIEMFGDVPYRASKPVDAGSGKVVSSRVITAKTRLTAANAERLGLPKDKGTVYAWRVSVIRRANGETHAVIEAMATDNGRSPDGEVLAHFKPVDNPDAMDRIAPAIVKAAMADWQAAQSQQAPEATEPVAQPITRADVAAAHQQAATLIAERIDAMTAGEVNTIARRFLPTMGVRPTVSKERNKAAVTDFTKVNPLAAADEFGATLPADVRRVLQADMEGMAVADGLVEQGPGKPILASTIKTNETDNGVAMFSRTGAKSPNAQQPTTRAWYDRFVSLLPASYRNDSHRREPLPAEDWNVQRSAEVREKIDALNKQLRGANDRKGYGPVSADGLGNLQVDARSVSAADLSGPIRALADELGAGVAATNVRSGDVRTLLGEGFVSETSLAAIADRLMGRPFAQPVNTYTKDSAPGTILTYKPRGFPAALFSRSATPHADSMFNGKEMANAPMPANAAPDAAATAQPPRTPAATIRAAITKAYGKLLGQLESKGLVTLTQTEDEAIEAAAKARADKTGEDVGAVRERLMASVRNSIAAWHGTPHRGIEQTGFTLNKIGTGEGAQAYGWGMYFASMRAVADGYRKRLSANNDPSVVVGGVRYENPSNQGWFDDEGNFADKALQLAADWAHGKEMPSQEEIDAAVSNGDDDVVWGANSAEDIDVVQAAWEIYDDLDIGEDGQLYSLDIPVEESDLLDWDKPLSEQSPKVREALERHRLEFEMERGTPASKHPDLKIYGSSVYGYIEERTGSQQAASEYLQSLGIPGLRYLDGNSRNSGDGSANYVIWDEALMTPEAANIEAKFSQDGAIQGFYDPQTGQSFLIADNLTAEAAPGVLMHEVGIHMAADGSMKALFNRAAMMLKLQRGNPFMKAVQDRMDAAGETSGEEAAAYIAEAYENDRANAPASVQRWLADLLAAVKAWMFKKGIMGADRLTVADIAAVARANARSMARDGGATGGQGFGTAFSRAPAGDQTQTDAFKRWFAGSKVVDADGKPLRVFHGTGGDFSVFSRDRAGATTGAANAGMGFFFTDNAEVAGNYARMSREPQSIMPVYLSLQNPLRMEAKNMMEADRLLQSGLKDNNDGAIITVAMRDGGTQTVYMARESSQVKSATGNNGNFDPANPDIRFSRAASPSTATAASPAWDAPVQTGFDDVIYKLQDKNIDLKRVVEAITKSVGQVADSINAYLKEELFHKRAAKRVADFGARELKPLMNQMRLAGLSMEDVEEYLHARHAKEANAVIAQRNPGVPGLQDGGSGMTNAAADNYFAKLNPTQRRKLEGVAAKVDAIIADTRKLYVEYGLEDQATVDGWAGMFQHYIPLMREDKEGGMGIGQGFSVKGRETKSRTGSTRKVVDILANIASQRERLIVRGEKNRVTQALVGLAQANPNPEFWEVRSEAPTERVFDQRTGVVVERPDPLFKSRENVVVAKVKDSKGNVTEQMVVFNEDNPRAVRMAAAMKNLDAGNLEGLLGMSAKVTRYFSAINTQYNPVFGVVNLIRDVQGAMVNLAATPLAGQQGKIARDTASALRGIYSDIRKTRRGGQATSQWAALWEQMQDDGGTTGYRELFTTSADRANNLKSILNPEAWMDSKWGKVFTADGKLRVPMSMAQKGASEIFGWLSDYNEAMENGVRLAAYKAALDKGMSREQAASLAKNLTVNFNRKGQVGQQAGAVYAFFNAAMQGTARIGQTLFDMDGGDISTLRLSKTGKAVVYGGVTLGAIQALALAAAGFDAEDPPEFVRERSLIIPTGGKTYVSIPMPLGLHVIPGIGRHATEFALSGFDKPAKRALSVIGMFADAFNPIGNAGLSMQTLAPTALDPLVALTENKDWTGKPIARVSFNKALPGHTQWKDTATWYSKMAAEAINWVSGGNEYVAGALSPTPDQIDYLVAQVGGGVAREASKVFQAASTTVNGEELPTYKIPLLGRFAGNAASQASQGTAFYANLDRLNALETEIKGLRKDGRFGEAAQLARENPQAIMIPMANRAERDVQKLRREKRELIATGANREEVRAKDAQITAVMARLNEAAARRKATAPE